MDMIAKQFATMVSLNPEAIAIEDGARYFTYENLSATAGAVATHLTELEAKLDTAAPRLVAILAGHSADAVALTVATVLAGWAYMPLDASTEEKTLAGMLAQSGVSAVLADPPNIARAHALADGLCPVLPIEDMLKPMRGAPAGLVKESPVKAEAPAYRLYTSGTSGDPKPVSHSRASLVRSVQCYCDDSDLRSGDRVSLVMPLSFTPSVFSLFGAVLKGATLCMFDVNRSDKTKLGDWVRSQKMTLLYVTPTLFRRWAKGLPDYVSGVAADHENLRMIQLAGEPLLASDVDLFQTKFPRTVQLYNGMGTTETSCAARYVIDHSMDFLDGSVPVGYRYEDVDLIIRNPEGRILGTGEIGDLYIKPLWADGSYAAVEFETGDLAMQDEGERLAHFGRRGDRVRIDGVGVDLLEVESLLMRHPEVLEAAVIADESGDGSELIVFVSRAQGLRIDVQSLQDRLAEHVPEQMVPAHWVITEALPTLRTGKVDRIALRKLAAQNTLRPKLNPRAPDALDLYALELFRSVLDNPDLASDADFAASGGDIGAALELTMAIERKHGIGLSISRISQASTPINLAHELRRVLVSEAHHDKSFDDLGALWELDHCLPLITERITAADLPPSARLLLNHQNSMTATLSGYSGGDVSLSVLAQRQAGRYFMRKIELMDAQGRTLAVAGIRIDLSPFRPAVRLEIVAGDMPFGRILAAHDIAVTHSLQDVFKTRHVDPVSYGRINRIEDITGKRLADVIELLSPAAMSL